MCADVNATLRARRGKRGNRAMARITEKTRRLNLHGEEIAYRTAGAGPALLLIHAITSASTVWDRGMPGLARQCTGIAPDLAGHRESHPGPREYPLCAHA